MDVMKIKNNASEKEEMSKEDKARCDALFREILTIMRRHFAPNTGLLWDAYNFAFDHHKKQTRVGGGPYLIHPLEVAKILANAGFDSDLIAAALLHDVVEDCGVTVEELARSFSDVIAETVDAVSAVSKWSEDPEMQKQDLDALSDVKFLTMTKGKKNRRAFYIKLADRIHNLRTIDVFPEEKQREKVLHTRNVLVPVAKELHVYTLIDVLEDLCLKIENPVLYREINDAYRAILRENESLLEGPDGIKQCFWKTIQALWPAGHQDIVSLFFSERRPESIARNLPDIDNLAERSRYLTKEYIPVYDIRLVVSDLCEESETDVFMKIYGALFRSACVFTVKGIWHTAGSGYQYYKAVDRYGMNYRLFVMKENEVLQYLHGASIDGSDDDIRSRIPYINRAEPDEPEHQMIRIYRKDGRADEIEEGATVLDFAFHINPKIGLCATGAKINGGSAIMPLHTRLRPGDMVEILCDYYSKKDREKEENKDKDDIPHATIRWFEYLHTREAVKNLTRWFEEHADLRDTLMEINFSKKLVNVPIGSTVLDFVINNLADPFCGFDLYINKSDKPAEISKILRHKDNVKIRYGDGTSSFPEIGWFRILKTQVARDRLVDFFESKKQKT